MNENTNNWREFLEERQLLEILFAQEYTNHYKHGTDGHHRLILICLLTDMLDFIWDRVLSEPQKELLLIAIEEAKLEAGQEHAETN